MAAQHEGKGGKYKYNKNKEDKEQQKKRYEAFLSDLADHVTKKRKVTNGNPEQFNMDTFNYDQFRNLQVSETSDDDSSKGSESS